MNAYIHGEWTQENTAARLARGKDELVFSDGSGKKEGWTAQTTQNGKGGRIIEMRDAGNVNNNAIQLGHEAYRDGITGNEQQQETWQAVLGHTVMAAKMQAGGNEFDTSGLLGAEMEAYKRGDLMGLFMNSQVNYDSSADYWKLTKDVNLIDDGDGWLRDQNTNLILDNDGNRIGAKGKETGLLNILFGGTNNRSYDSFSDEEINATQQIMIHAGMPHSGEENIRARNWGGTIGKIISAKTILSGFGDTVATAVFMNGFDLATDTLLFSKNFGQIDRTLRSIPQKAQDRFNTYLNTKGNFYRGEHIFFNESDLSSLNIIDGYQPDAFYIGNGGQHTGFDIRGVVAGGANGKSTYSLFSGKVIRSDYTASAGNTVVLEYGFNFENSFYSTGIQAQYMHLKSKSSLKQGEMTGSATYVGSIGSTGNSSGPHLHYQIMGNMPGYGATNIAWNMLDNRRNSFLEYIGSPNTSAYSTTPSMQNYYSNSYSNYYYNLNNLLHKLHIKLGERNES